MASRRARQRYRRRCARRKRVKRRASRPSVVVDPRTLPSKPSSVCGYCWRGPFAAHFDLLSAPDTRTPGGDRAEGYSYSVQWGALQSRARFGCKWCRVLVAVLSTHARIPTDCRIRVGLDGGTLGYCSPPGARKLRLSTRYWKDGLGGGSNTPYVAYTTADDPAAPFITARPRIVDVGSQSTMALAKQYFDACVHGHERCRALDRRTESIPLPTRLIDCTDPCRPRLVHSCGSFGEYLTLSYVWGGPQPHRTTTANISTYTDHIDLSKLPRTIRDAITVTHSLGFRLLWVDSLCIIQDSREDKHREMLHMRHVYRNASLTLIAASASNANQGFLEDRPSPQTHHTLPFVCPTAHEPHRVADQEVNLGRTGTVHLAAYHTDLFSRDPIHGRGWCLQELLMSLRSLIFTSETVHFRCQTATLALGHSYCDENSGCADSWRLPDTIFHHHPVPFPPQSKPWVDAWRMWRRVLEEYTPRTVSFPSDKLVALAGIAEDFQRILGSGYLAGLWHHPQLTRDLLWTRAVFPSRCNRSDFQRPLDYRAPSWSWAASNVPITFDSRFEADEYRPAAEVIQCQTKLVDEALPFGEVTGGCLVLAAPMIPCIASEESYTNTWYLQLHLVTSWPHRESGSNHPIPYSAPRQEGSSTIYAELDADGELCLANGLKPKLWLALMLWHTVRTEFVECLLLMPAGSDEGVQEGLPDETTPRTVYRRIGCCRLGKDDLEAAGWGGQLDLTEIEII
ncbi:heterokaryon incompatibility protein-domain-containing protein [Trametes polyzona]|nr:heterokaryon incompatibility protein-domain-containing protein [Trametes polyzona]